MYTCSECKSEFASKSDLFHHMLFHAREDSDEDTEEEDGNREEDDAKQNSSEEETPEKRVTHNTSNTSSTSSEVKQKVKKEGYITCLQCLNKFESHITFNKHVDQGHPNVKFSCLVDDCSALFST